MVLTPDLVSWMDKAIDVYWKDRIYKILELVGKEPDSTVLARWNEVLEDICGEEAARKRTIYDIALNDDKVNPEEKTWLNHLLNQ